MISEYCRAQKFQKINKIMILEKNKSIRCEKVQLFFKYIFSFLSPESSKSILHPYSQQAAKWKR